MEVEKLVCLLLVSNRTDEMIRIRCICRVRVSLFYPFDHDQKPVALVITILVGKRFPQSFSVLFGVLCTNGKATFQPNTTSIDGVVL